VPDYDLYTVNSFAVTYFIALNSVRELLDCDYLYSSNGNIVLSLHEKNDSVT